jgi:hypothetical protein
MLAGIFVMAMAAVPAAIVLMGALGGGPAAVALVILREGSGRYRTHCGEGRWSQHYTMTTVPGVDPLGTHITELAAFYGDLKVFLGLRFSFTSSEYKSAVLLMEAIERSVSYSLLVRALEKLQHTTEDSLTAAIEKEIDLRIVQLRPAVLPLANFLSHCDSGRVEAA